MADKGYFRHGHVALVALAVGVSVPGTPRARAQSSLVMAPPLVTPFTGQRIVSQPIATPDVFQWQDVPLHRNVPITRAVFDQGGYQLFDDVGETIVVPFVSGNLFVMRFGRSAGGAYFVNDGTMPTLYLPRGGYLENAAAGGARWYPFPDDSHDLDFVAPAPTWDEYETVVWFPDTVIVGGYAPSHSPKHGTDSPPQAGYVIRVDGHTFHSWHDYHTFTGAHPPARIVTQTLPNTTSNPYQVPQRGPGHFGHPGDRNGGNGGSTSPATQSPPLLPVAIATAVSAVAPATSATHPPAAPAQTEPVVSTVTPVSIPWANRHTFRGGSGDSEPSRAGNDTQVVRRNNAGSSGEEHVTRVSGADERPRSSPSETHASAESHPSVARNSENERHSESPRSTSHEKSEDKKSDDKSSSDRGGHKK